MKKINILLIANLFLLPIIMFFTSGCSSTYRAGSTSNDIQQEYNLDELNRYGEWVQVNDYGSAWHPYVSSDWAPFDNGHWSYINGAWTWVSYEPFGWIVYHYGNWYTDPFYGWVWIPSDGPWSPARVVWMDYGDYVSWAPLPPGRIAYGNPWEENESRYWHVVRKNDFTRDNVRQYRVERPLRNEEGRSVVVTRPPARNEIESAGGTVSVGKATMETKRVQNKVIQKVILPPQEAKKVEQNEPRVKREVLIPKQQVQKQKIEKKQNTEKEKQNKEKQDKERQDRK